MKTNYGTKLIASMLGISMMFFGIYQAAFAFTYGGGVFITSGTQVAMVAAKPASTAKPTPKNTTPTFTLKELAKYDGQNGHKAYVAVDGVVYDMTLLGSWKNGQHHGLSAGTDLSAAFSQSPHAKSILKLVKNVGTLVTTKATATTPAPAAPAKPAPTKASPAKTTPAVAAVSSATAKRSAPAASTGTSPVASSSATQKSPPTTWTLSALKQYNGSNGNPAYISVNGTIYDVSGSWQNGSHHGIRAGQDVTQAFASSPHSKSLLSQLPIVGQIGKTMTVSPVKTAVTSTGTPQYHVSDEENDDHENDDDD